LPQEADGKMEKNCGCRVVHVWVCRIPTDTEVGGRGCSRIRDAVKGLVESAVKVAREGSCRPVEKF